MQLLCGEQRRIYPIQCIGGVTFKHAAAKAQVPRQYNLPPLITTKDRPLVVMNHII